MHSGEVQFGQVRVWPWNLPGFDTIFWMMPYVPDRQWRPPASNLTCKSCLSAVGRFGEYMYTCFWSHQNWKAAAWPCHMPETTRRARRSVAILQPYSSTRTPQDNAAQRQTNTQAYECSDFTMSAPMAENNQYEQACTTSTDICCAVPQQIPLLVFNEFGAFSNRAESVIHLRVFGPCRKSPFYARQTASASD